MNSSKAQHLNPYLFFSLKLLFIPIENTITCVPVRSYAIDMLLALPDQYLPLKTIEMTFSIIRPYSSSSQWEMFIGIEFSFFFFFF